MGVNTPKKMGPMLKMADVVVITKGDIVSQAEREIFALKVRQANPKAMILSVNGINGQGAGQLAAVMEHASPVESLKGERIRMSMPAALCSYCLGETQLGKEKQKGNVRRMVLD
jgi:Ni2+-binding GTPase involved in maturation of urease and hydrogenase